MPDRLQPWLTVGEVRSPLAELAARFGDDALAVEATRDGVPTAWVGRERIHEMLAWLKRGARRPYRMLYDLFAVDERVRHHRHEQARDFTVVYQLASFDRNADVRLKVPLDEGDAHLPTATPLWPSASWYEREAWDMFGVRFDGHPLLRRLLMPRTWKGHPLRKEHPARATEMAAPDWREWVAAEEAAQRFDPDEWGFSRQLDGTHFTFLNVGPQHPGTHGVLRVILQLDGEEIVDAAVDIGYHHRGQEKMAERQTWHTYIPYTDRIDYLGGVMNNLPYVMAVEQLAGIEVPDRARMVRIMLCELFRIASHLVWYGTFAQDVGQLSPVFYTFNDRERVLEIVEALCGARMHPNWFRIGGVAQDLPRGWDRLVRDLLDYLPARFDEYDAMVLKNSIFKARTKGVGQYTLAEAIDWGVTGPGLRACGLEWDYRKMRPYGGYDQLEFDVPTATGGDSYARAEVRVEEMRQSLRIVRQCLENMPPGDYKARHPSTTPPYKDEGTMRDIETLIGHFLNTAWGPVVPAGEGGVMVEGTKGNNGYYLVSDGDVQPYRVRIRTPSFAHMQMLPLMVRGLMVSDLLTVLGSMDFVLADVDR